MSRLTFSRDADGTVDIMVGSKLVGHIDVDDPRPSSHGAMAELARPMSPAELEEESRQSDINIVGGDLPHALHWDAMAEREMGMDVDEAEIAEWNRQNPPRRMSEATQCDDEIPF